jgi:hypothetical protein
MEGGKAELSGKQSALSHWIGSPQLPELPKQSKVEHKMYSSFSIWIFWQFWQFWQFSDSAVLPLVF